MYGFSIVLIHQMLIIVTSHEILGPNEVPGRNWDIDIFWYLYISGVYM